MPRRGDIAVCSHGYIGLILKDASIPNTSPTGVVEADLWTGIHLTTKGGKQIGGLWQSRNPQVIAHSNMLATMFEKAAKWDELQAERQEQREREARQREPGEAYVTKDDRPYNRPRPFWLDGAEPNPPEPGNLFPKVVKKGGAFDIEELKRRGQLGGVSESYPSQPPEPPRFLRSEADGLFDDDVMSYTGD